MSGNSLMQTLSDLAQGFAKRKGVEAIQGNDYKSYIGVAKPATVEPITLIDSRLETYSYLSPLLGNMLNMFAAYYIMATRVIANPEQIELYKTLDSLNPHRDVFRHLIDHWNANAREDMRIDTQSHEKGTGKVTPLTFESNPTRFHLADLSRIDLENSKTGSDVLGIKEAPNLCVGKMLRIGYSFKNGDKEPIRADVDVNVRLVSGIVSSKLLRTLLGRKMEDRTFLGRLDKWRLGEISTADLFFCTDLYREHKQLLAADETGLISTIYKRERDNAVAEFVSNRGSHGLISNLLIIDNATVKELTNQTGHDITLDFKSREQMINDSGLMIIAVVDRELGVVDIYRHLLKPATTLMENDLKQSKGGSGPDLSEILKAYQLGSNSSF
jgi:hypothetical protein